MFVTCQEEKEEKEAEGDNAVEEKRKPRRTARFGKKEKQRKKDIYIEDSDFEMV